MTDTTKAPILMIEDSEDDYFFAKRAFKKAEFENQLNRFASGEDALEYLQDDANQLPSLILLDLNLPGITGHEVIKEMKKKDKLNMIPIVILSTSVAQHDIDTCYTLGANSYLHKPIDIDSLVKTFALIKKYWMNLVLLPKKLTI